MFQRCRGADVRLPDNWRTATAPTNLGPAAKRLSSTPFIYTKKTQGARL
jgi:hypothetical protein